MPRRRQPEVLGRSWRGLPVDVLELVLDFDGRRFHRRGGAYRLDPEDPRYAMVDRVPRSYTHL